MEDNRHRLAVVVAGSGDEMRQFIASNPGLQSLFTTTIHFDDYTAEELTQIFGKFAGDQGLTMSAETEAKVAAVCRRMKEEAGQEFGNARRVRNLVERSVKRLATRLASAEGSLTQIEPEDIPERW